MNNEQKLKTTSSIVSIACSALSTEITTTTSTTTTPTTSAVPQTSVQKPSLPPAAATAASSQSSSSQSTALSAAACKSASLAITNSSPMSDAAAAGQQRGSPATILASTEATAAIAKKDVTISTIANVDTSASTPALVISNSTPKVATTELTGNNSNGINSEKSKKTELWEECGLKDWDDSSLKNLLEEAYSYKTPRDKENKSEYFLQLLQNAENEKEDQTFAFRAIASRYTRNSATSTASNSHKQGGSLQDLVEAVRNESLLDCDYQFGVGGQRNRRHNHNSRQKKYSSVSSRQREGGSLPSNVNVTYCGGSNLLSSALDQQTAPAFMHEVVGKNNIINCSSKQQQRRNKANERTVAASLTAEKDLDSTSAFNTNGESTSTISCGALGGVVVAGGIGANTNCAAIGDCVIEMGEPMMDIQQQQQILQAKGQDAATQGLPYYDRLDSIDMRIPRANVISSMQTKTDFAPTSSQCYVDEAVRFTTLERGGVSASAASAANCGQNKVSSSTIDTKYLPLDENYKSCKSVMGEKSELVKTSSTMFSTTKTITRQFDDEMYPQGAAAAIFNASATGVGNSSTVSQSQAKAKNKKKSQQERNTKTVDVKSVAGYRGNDPVEVLVKYIESSEDKQNEKSTTNNNKFNENSKKKERKKDKEKQHKMKKSNSLEELRSCSKIDVEELKTSAATTESNVIMRNKSGKNKNNSASAADINKNYESKDLATNSSKALNATSPPAATTSSNNQRKGERRSWGTEELQYLGESNCGDEKTVKEKRTNKNKDIEKDEKTKDLIKEKSTEKQDKNSNFIEASTASTPLITNKTDKVEKRKKSDSNVQATSSLYGEDALALDTSLLPEAAEFHVVTKKKKPKKQRASLDETNSSSSYTTGIGGFNRSTNFMSNMQKSTSYVPGTQRYKYYNQHANNEYLHAYNNNVPNNNINNNQPTTDKSRRKSTSSMPPSEKSDSSDLDSVHSLPIESTTTNTSTKTKQRHKNTNATTAGHKTGAVSNSLAPISYADIARTNKEQQLTPTSSAAAGTGDKWPAVDTINNNSNPTNNSILASESMTDSNNTELTAGAVQSPPASIMVTKHKTKKLTSKPDFPELVATLSSPITTFSQLETTKPTNCKQISYSQSLTAEPAAIAVTVNAIDAAPISVTEQLNKEKSEKRYVAAAASIENELDTLSTNNAISMQQNIRPQQQQQQPLQKSKSVEHESYNYNFNSSNLDQQYPALEKTVKRHSAATVVVGGGLSNVAAFHFAAATKQPYANNIDESVLTTITPATIKPTATNATSPNAVAASTVSVKKSKEKSTSAAPSMMSTIEPLSNSSQVVATTAMRKSKKEKYQQLQNELSQNKSTNTSTQTAAAYVSTTNRGNSFVNVVATNANNKKSHGNNCTHTKVHNKSHALNKHSASGVSNVSNTATNRPAVIILNDDRTVGGYTASNEFTFGDFNEEELKFFDDDIVAKETEVTDDDYCDYNEEDDDNNNALAAENVSGSEQEKLSTTSVPAEDHIKQGQTIKKRKTSPPVVGTQSICFNDSGANFNTTSASSSSSSSDIGACVLNISAQPVDDILLSGADASSPNTSLLVGANQSSDSGIYTNNKTKNINNTKKISANLDVVDIKSSINNTTEPKIASNKLNAFLNTPSTPEPITATRSTAQTTPANGTSTSTRATVKEISVNKSSSVSLPPPQQLETCNDIETAIIAAARAAAEQQSQQQQPNFNSSSASSSFSSSSSVSIDSKYSSYQPQQQNHYHRQHRHYSQQTEDEQQEQQERARSRSNSSQRDVAAVVSNVQHKDLDLYFISPTMPTAMSSLQHNEIIVDFIGSAWEEVSKVTKFYEGQ